MRKLLFWFFALVLFSPQVFAYSGITAIGDSLFDGGNEDTAVVSYYKLFGAGLTDAPYSNYRFTNGPTAVEYLATGLGLNSPASFQNFAVGGATTADMLTFMTSYLNTVPSIDAGHLYVLDGGGNGIETFSAQDSAQNMIDMVALLHSKGATDFLVLGLPALVDAPRFSAAAPGVVQFLEDYTRDYNDYLVAGLAGLGLPTTANLTYFDTKTELENGIALAVSNGFTNLTDACYDGATVCANPDQYLFWDDLHMTTKVHEYLGQRLFAAISPVPEPTQAGLLFAGLLLVFARRSLRPAI
ncbi:SGNH/GDSL hydrolase family protein [Methylophilus sp. QUAN]|uniref:SGNH/GDSL hydrolase family protein n=1 Tax=Methylophilus sp. QUAN TaxID=2781020 RepID=UPI00188DDA7A|nr:SGNH/GDSL hydrolase family protein [Methylophilus sp. QUAN]MBF4989847.1 SGNH/GDSL hydrolase family protein [Methylophilus sp. QUAN]